MQLRSPVQIDLDAGTRGSPRCVVASRRAPAPGRTSSPARVGELGAGDVYDTDAITITKAGAASVAATSSRPRPAAPMGSRSSARSVLTLGALSESDVFGAPPAPPAAVAVLDARPNPFSGSTVLAYEVPETSRVRLVVYDARGREIAVLVDGTQEAGRYQARFDAQQFPSGVYLYRLMTDSGVATGRMTRLR